MARHAYALFPGADIITIGPGSLYTSIIPNLLVDGVTEGTRDSNALVFCFCNIITQPGETDGFDVQDHCFVRVQPGSKNRLRDSKHRAARSELPGKYLANGALKWNSRDRTMRLRRRI